MNNIKTLQVLNIAQPWAHCVVHEGKNVENRSQNLKKRGTIAIYASKTILNDRFEACLDLYKIKLNPADLPLGAIVGIVDVVDVITENTVTARTKKWYVSKFGYVFENIIELQKPVFVKPPQGAVKFWPLNGKGLNSILAQLSDIQINKIKEFK